MSTLRRGVSIAAICSVGSLLAWALWKPKRNDEQLLENEDKLIVEHLDPETPAIVPLVSLRSKRQFACITKDLMLRTELWRRGVEAYATPQADRDTIWVKTHELMKAETCAAYAALHWYRLSHRDVTMNHAKRLLPFHHEVMYNGKPYVNTLPLLRVPQVTQLILDFMAHHVRELRATVLVAFETRAMSFAAMLAHETRLAFVPARGVDNTPLANIVKQGISGTSYRHEQTVAIDGEAFTTEDRVVIIDDVVFTGSTIRALSELIKQRGAHVSGCVALVEFIDERFTDYRPSVFYSFIQVPHFDDSRSPELDEEPNTSMQDPPSVCSTTHKDCTYEADLTRVASLLSLGSIGSGTESAEELHESL